MSLQENEDYLPAISAGGRHGRRRKEGRMPKKEEEPILPLKNGSTANVRHALAERRNLERLLRHAPQHFDILLKLCQGTTAEAIARSGIPAEESLKYLQNDTVLQKDGTVRPIVRDVLLSSYQVTPDGPAITMPFAFTTHEQTEMVDAIQQQINERATRLFKYLGWGRDDGPLSR